MPEGGRTKAAVTGQDIGSVPAAGLQMDGRRETERAFSFADFCGTWKVGRVIVDHRSAAVHRFEGTAVIDASEFVESGAVRYGAVSLKADRRYRLETVAGRLAIAFPDGRPFISLGGGGLQRVEHLCGDDDYRGRFVFADANGWIETWRVTGPRKRYASLARYSRQGV